MEWITAVSSAIMALVWIVYFQLFFRQYRLSNRPYLVIHHAQNENPDALCLMINMGKEPVHVQCVQVLMRSRDGGESTLTVTEYRRVSPEDHNIQQILRQGPVQPGGYLMLGSFRNILLGRRSRDEEADYSLREIEEFELRAALVHAPSRYPVGVRRRFRLGHEDGTHVFPYSIYTEQLAGRRHRDTVRQWVEGELNPERRGPSETESADQSA